MLTIRISASPSLCTFANPKALPTLHPPERLLGHSLLEFCFNLVHLRLFVLLVLLDASCLSKGGLSSERACQDNLWPSQQSLLEGSFS
ncbi:unnamed protein product [Protopolystoma xenopodis]|uniref:Uncharacterized protein n=1 Tax=Protopolystoma xenopodis TaxID=117903 RepID=A0A448XN96_9PLAT|nr:unnamed protein product [Protopolystoma xenopodis]